MCFDYEILDRIADVSAIERDITIGNTIIVRRVYYGKSGIYILAETNDGLEAFRQAVSLIRGRLCMGVGNVFFFIVTEEGAFLAEKDEEGFVPVEDLEQGFYNFYNNHLRPAVDLRHINFRNYAEMLSEPELPESYYDEVDDTGDLIYVEPLISDLTIEQLKITIDRLRSGNESLKNSFTDENGTRYDKHSVSQRITGLVTGEAWYKVAEKDPDKEYLRAFAGGWSGLHKFMDGDIVNGLIYLFSCGFLGVWYVSDLLFMILGNYSYQEVAYSEDSRGMLIRSSQKVYYPPVRNKIRALILIPGAVVIAVLLIRFVYKPVYMAVAEIMANLIMGILKTT